ncbi:MAG: helix-turn-helix transcriptional regulator [Acidobacteriota bacterium]
MSSTLEEILEAAEALERNAGGERQTAAIGQGLGLYRCSRPQEIRDIRVNEACVLLVLRGRKQLATSSRSWTATDGEMLLVPAGLSFWLGNYPRSSGVEYRGLAIRFGADVVELFRQLYGPRMVVDAAAGRWHAPAPAAFLEALGQWIAWSSRRRLDDEVARHRRVELLWLLARAELAGHLLTAAHASWRRRVTELFELDPAHPWRIDEVGAKLGVSESTLRRHLQGEGQGFRNLLEEVRLMVGLTLVQESSMAIGRIADAVGYRSQSRFGERFKRRFGMTPSTLRQTRLPVPAEGVAESPGEFSGSGESGGFGERVTD